jgi:hypothetical protein
VVNSALIVSNIARNVGFAASMCKDGRWLGCD